MQSNFYPRPPRGGRLADFVWDERGCKISIHALREEGDIGDLLTFQPFAVFLSTPSARRATSDGIAKNSSLLISIHALREEGDAIRGYWEHNDK